MNSFAWFRYDLRHAVRSLVRDRGSVGLALLALSLGIGASTVIFSVVYSVFINAFPFPDSSRVVHFFIHAPDRPGRSAWYPATEFADYRAQNHVFSDVLGGVSLEVLYSLENSTYRVRGALSRRSRGLVARSLKRMASQGRRLRSSSAIASGMSGSTAIRTCSG